MQKAPLTLIQLTDCHLFGDASKDLMAIKTCQSFTDTVNLVLANEEAIDQVLVTGDISQDNSRESYVFCQQVLDRLNAPSAWLCGNHDEADDLSAGEFAERFPKTVELGNWVIVLLNTQVQNESYGELTEQELDFMENILAENPERPVLLAMHHHPIPVDSPWMDEIPMANGEHLMERLRNHSNVRLIIHGHIHQERETESSGISILATPSTSVQFAPGATGFEADTRQPGYRKISLYPDGNFDTEVHRLPEGSWLPDLSQPGY